MTYKVSNEDDDNRIAVSAVSKSSVKNQYYHNSCNIIIKSALNTVKVENKLITDKACEEYALLLAKQIKNLEEEVLQQQQ